MCLTDHLKKLVWNSSRKSNQCWVTWIHTWQRLVHWDFITLFNHINQSWLKLLICKDFIIFLGNPRHKANNKKICRCKIWILGKQSYYCNHTSGLSCENNLILTLLEEQSSSISFVFQNPFQSYCLKVKEMDDEEYAYAVSMVL